MRRPNCYIFGLDWSGAGPRLPENGDMDRFDLSCPNADDPVEITFAGELLPRGKPAFRGFSCASEADCLASGVQCALFDVEGFEPFAPTDALRHLNG